MGNIPLLTVKKAYHKIPRRHGAKGIKRRDIYAAIAILSIILIAANYSNIRTQTGLPLPAPPTTTTTTSAGSNLCGVTKPLQVTEIDALGGSAFNAPTGTFYQGTSPFTQLEAPSFSSSGVATTGGKYSTGTALALQLSGASQATEFLGGTNNVPFLVPPMTCGDTSTNNVFNIYGITLATYTITVAGSGSTTFISGGNFFFSQFPAGISGVATITVTVSVGTNNQGYKTSYDFLNGLWQYLIVEVKDTSSNLAVTGMPRSVSPFGSTTRYWPVACEDGLVGAGYGSANGGGTLTVMTGGNPSSTGGNQQSIGTYDAICSGSASLQKIGTIAYGSSGVQLSFGVSRGSLGAGSTEALKISVFKYGDYNWFAANGVYGPNAVQVGGPSGAAAGTSYTLNLINA